MTDPSSGQDRPKVVLLAAPWDPYVPGVRAEVSHRNAPTMALYYLAAIVEAAGFEVHVIDTVGYADFMADPEPHLAGALAVGISANTMTWPGGLAAARVIASLPRRPWIVLGGLHPTLFDEHALDVSGADFVVRGEGEATFPALLWVLASREPGGAAAREEAAGLAGVTARLDGTVARGPDRPLLTPAELAATPLPAYERVPPGAYGTIPVEASRGCRFSCGFCSIAGRRGHRSLPLASVVARIREAVRHRGRAAAGVLLFVDDCFTSSPDATRIAEFIAAEHPDVPLAIEARADDLLRPGLLEAISACRVSVIQVGIECGYKDGLRRVGKGVTLDKVEAACARLRDAGLNAGLNAAYILGFPWEGVEEVLSTVYYALSLGREIGYLAQLVKWAPFPGARLTEALGLPPDTFDTPGWLTDDAVRAKAHPRLDQDDWRVVGEVTRLLKVLYSDVRVVG